MAILTALDIYKNYTINRKLLSVLKGINLKIEKGEILIVLGPSGSGKSTLLHILGFLDQPSKGSLIFNEVEIPVKSCRIHSRIRNRDIGFVFQFYNLLPDFTVIENVELPGLIAGGGYKHRRNLRIRAKDILEKIGLKDRLKHRPDELSGGEQQRAAIARALINQPSLLLADEPTGNLDTYTSEKIWSLFSELNQEKQQTIVIVTHNKELAERGTRTLYMENGLLSATHLG